MNMIEHQIRRREELRINPRDVAKPTPTGGKGSHGNTGHLNLDRPMPTAPTGTKKMARYRVRVALLTARRSKRKAVAAKRKPLGEYIRARILVRERTLAYIRELASLARTPHEIAALLHVSNTTVYKRMRQGNIKVAKRDTPLEAAVRKAYAPGGGGPRVGAEAYGSSPKTFMVVAGRLGLSRPSDNYRFKRGFDIPPERIDEYRELRSLHLTTEEIGQNMGLIPRPPLEPRPASRYSRPDQEARP